MEEAEGKMAVGAPVCPFVAGPGVGAGRCGVRCFDIGSAASKNGWSFRSIGKDGCAGNRRHTYRFRHPTEEKGLPPMYGLRMLAWWL